MKFSLVASVVSGLLITSSFSYGMSSANANEQQNQETQQLRELLNKQQKALQDLKHRLELNEQRLAATADQIDEVSSAKSSTVIGGYGELHYNNIDDKKTMDFHRFVLFASHEFTDKLRFFSELEVEHVVASSDPDDSGEVELEQAYIEYDFAENATAKMGMFLVPVGIINETHEPPTFYGVERNPVEKNIIPVTWWEGGAMVNYRPVGGVSFDFALTSGLNVADDYLIRGGRQQVMKANADSLAFTSRVKYTAINGLTLAASVQYQQDITQGKVGVDKADATLVELHGIYQVNNFSVKGLYARWDISGNEAKVLGRDEQTGWYVEPSYKFNEKVGVFARYAEYDNNAGNSDDTSKNQTNVGVNYYLHENVVLKADWEEHGDSNKNGFNLGVGYQF